ncbi:MULTISPECIES: ATP-binding protein [unclassified Streptomyces]|uniref:ATP-binding protein n=1 Tax=unclassified Streptomyces TaxID=2593676 RepID=UPI000DAEA43F|nr:MULTISPECIES: ATP-binding protein [unclassified Streptomyces]PZT72333.1 ATP-binding protein [Streptomyces sp. AC1-42T]PZT81345.1 ATP-binding protein [Streptomyces sp. AC1-42W]
MTTPGLTAPHPGDLFELRFSSTARGARLARRLASHRVHAWGHRYGSEVNDTVGLIVGELAANAVTHGRVPGRDARLRLIRVTRERWRVEVSDTRGERRPAARAVLPAGDEETGRGLLLVAALSQEWGVDERRGGPGKTVWAVVTVPPRD